MVNDAAVKEIGEMIGVKRYFELRWPLFHEYTAEEIMKTREYRFFKAAHPELVRCVEEWRGDIFAQAESMGQPRKFRRW